MSIHSRFQDFLHEETTLFQNTCEMMIHSQVQNGRQFLCAMNNVVDYCCLNAKKDNDGINYHIVFIPTCPDWARELLSRFLLHKIAFTYSDEFVEIAKRKTPKIVYLPENITKKQTEILQQERRYFKKFIRLFGGKTLPENNQNKSLFVLQDRDIVTRNQDKNPWLEQLYTDSIFDESRNAVVTTTDTAYDIEDKIKFNNGDVVPTVENIFVFHSQNRGKITFSYNMQMLERLNRRGLGVKNCIVFYISEQPFRLYHIQDNIKFTLVSHLLNCEIKRYDDFNGFVTFTPQEIDALFNRENCGIEYQINPCDREIFTADIDSYFDELPHNYKIKNSLSLAFTEESQHSFLMECEREFGTSQISVLSPFFNYYKQIWKEEVSVAISSMFTKCRTVTFILPVWATKEQKSTLIQAFQTERLKVFVSDFESLKNGIQSDMIVLFSYRYTDGQYKTFPNSFDPLPLKPGQKGITIINRLTHNRHYEWNKHFYDKAYNGLLYSDFRVEKIGWGKKKYQQPVTPGIFDYVDEAEADARDYMIEKAVIQFENEEQKSLAASARVLYRDGQSYCISSLKDLAFEDEMEIQVLDDIVERVKKLLNQKTDNSRKAEEYLRRDEKYRLTEEEITSKVELWKYLLIRKVNESSIKQVYESVFPITKEISMHGFERWLDVGYPMILPRSRKSQNNLLTFLGFKLGGPYHRIILTKKLMRNSDTRMLNSQIESLLQNILTISEFKSDDFEKLFEMHSDILTLLGINNASDIIALIELMDIHLKKVICIKK